MTTTSNGSNDNSNDDENHGARSVSLLQLQVKVMHHRPTTTTPTTRSLRQFLTTTNTSSHHQHHDDDEAKPSSQSEYRRLPPEQLIPMYIMMMLEEENTSPGDEPENATTFTTISVEKATALVTTSSSSTRVPYIFTLLVPHKDDLHWTGELWRPVSQNHDDDDDNNNNNNNNKNGPPIKERLWMWQYVMGLAQSRLQVPYQTTRRQRNARMIHAMMCVRVVVLPLLLLVQPPPTVNDGNDNEDDFLHRHQPPQPQSWISTIFDTILPPPFHDDDDGDDDDHDDDDDDGPNGNNDDTTLLQWWIQSCLDAILDSIQTTPGQWSHSGTVLHRFGQYLLEWQRRRCRTTPLPLLTSMVLDAIQVVVQSALDNVRRENARWNRHYYQSTTAVVISSSQLVLPLVTDFMSLVSAWVELDKSTASTVTSLSNLWNMIWEQYPEETPTMNPEDNDSLSAIVTPFTSIMTSMVCSLLPTIISVVPIASFNNHHVSKLWTLIQQCLRYGLLYHVDHRGRQRRRRLNDVVHHTSGHCFDTIRLYQLHRRRGIYLLRCLVEHYFDGGATATAVPNHPGNDPPPPIHHQQMVGWRKFVSCFEMIEMESEAHLMDQVWEPITELFEHMMTIETTTLDRNEATMSIPILTWDWMKLLLGRILISQDSPILRKLGLFRLLKGQAGIRIEEPDHPVNRVEFGGDKADGETASGPKTKSHKSKKSNASGPKTKSPSTLRRGAPLTVITVDFFFTVIVSSFDTLMSSVGTNMQATAVVLSNDKGGSGTLTGYANSINTNVSVSEDMIPLLCNFVSHYLQQLIRTSFNSEDQLEAFFRRLWSPDIVDGVHHKITVQLYCAVADSLRHRKGEMMGVQIPIRNDTLPMISMSFQLAFSDGSMVSAYKDSLLQSLATMLENSVGIGHSTPLAILDVIALFPIQMLQCQEPEDVEISVGSNFNSVSVPLGHWLKTGVTFAVNSAPEVGATVATAFVDGMLQSNSSNETTDWNAKSGCSDRERNLAKAIVFFCILSHHDENPITTGALLWPAIHKGLSHVPALMIGGNWVKADCVSRALLLLDFGVHFRVLSGLGNGDLVVNERTQNMLPPPQNVDLLLGAGVTFIFYQIESLFDVKSIAQATRSSSARILSTTFANLVEQLQSLSNGFPSSSTITKIVDDKLRNLVASLVCDDVESCSRALDIALLFATLSSNGDIQKSEAVVVAERVLRSHFIGTSETVSNVQPVRSIFQFSKWGALSSILSKILTDIPNVAVLSDISLFLDELFATATDSVESTPSTALVPLFNCVVIAAKLKWSRSSDDDGNHRPDNYTQFDKVIRSLFGLIDACDCNSDTIGMIDQLCSLLFQPELMIEEYKRFQEYPDCDTPIRDAFRRLVKISGTERPHISRIVVSRICASWLKANVVGLTAIPYRDDIVQLLVHKENLVPVTSLFTYEGNSIHENEIKLVANTNDTNISRGFLLVFFSKLPDPEKNLSTLVQTELLQYIIVKLNNLVAQPPTSGSGLIMHGTPEYCVKIRALQALCILSRFVTVDIADQLCKGLFGAMGKQTSHNQIRYFLEVFALRFARMHASLFIQAFVEQIRRTDLSLQMIASLMIISGNLIVGRYKDEFFQQYNIGEMALGSGSKINLHSIVAGVVPWLSSTQGFSRAIAQLLTHKLIPLVVNVENPPSPDTEDSHWYLRSLYRFLDENPEMKRLRKKQQHFFERYEVDSVCTPEGLFAIPVDEGQEANPVHMIEIIKDCLQEVYDDANIDRAPLWKQIEVATQNDISQNSPSCLEGDVNFQRKIIPIDELNLAMDDIRDQKHRNRIGRMKQNFIVCATLIDKVPNLGGLARTCEIFSIHKLIVPDIQVTKMDNFKNLCVGAGDWIDIDECKQQNLLPWLRQRRDEGYTIVGLEQTSSSESLLDYQFPPSATFMSEGSKTGTGGTVLLLGKEKEGIPIEYLQMVDQCIEIPQYGIIRSLNVHVSGAIAIWEYTKQQKQQHLTAGQ